jgi:hypothetical protein
MPFMAFFRLCILTAGLSLAAAAQTGAAPATTQPQTPGLSSISSVFTNLDSVAPAAYVLSSVAQGATDWHLTVAGKQYDVSATKQTAVTGAVVGVALVVRYLWPKSRKWVDGGLLIAAGAFAGVSYAQAQRH